MKVNAVKILNLDNIYQCIADAQHNQTFKNLMFGVNYSQLLNHINIILELDEVTRMDLIFLKMFCSSVFMTSDFKINAEFISRSYPEIYQSSISPLLNFLEKVAEYTLNTDNGVDYIDLLSPMGIQTTECIVSFTGNQLANILSLSPEVFFIEATKGECLEHDESSTDRQTKFNREYDIYSSENLDNHIIQTFINNFYKFMVEKTEYIDILSDSTIHGNFFKKVKNNSVSIESIRNPFGHVDLVNDSPETIKNTFRFIKENMNKEDLLNNTIITFDIKVPFVVFSEFFRILPYDRFSSLESMRVPISNSLDAETIMECPSELSEKFNARYNGRLSEMIHAVNAKYNSNAFVMKKIEMTESYEEYTFTLSLKFSDVDTYLSKYNPESRLYTEHETKRLFNMIQKYIVTFYMSMK
jgi:hypothetical protein